MSHPDTATKGTTMNRYIVTSPAGRVSGIVGNEGTAKRLRAAGYQVLFAGPA